ncbi:MAG: transposase [Deltaproteobacteria bacterium]|nr:transposase [Deltaproteobacteria bacterium]
MAATIAGLQAELAAKAAEHAAKVAALEDSLTELAHENALLKRRLFGSKTEALRTSELQLALGDLLATEAKLQAELDASVEKADDAAPKATPGEGTGKPRPHGRRNLFASNLPRVAIEIREAALEAQGARLIRFEDAAQLAFRRGGFYVVVKRVAQYEVVRDGAATVVPAPAPEMLFPKALLHTSTVAHLLTSKFALGVPHYRLERDLLDQGMRLDRGLMSRYVEHAGNTLGATVVAAM